MNKKGKKGQCCNRLVVLFLILGLVVNTTACGTRDDNTDTAQKFSIAFSWWGNDTRHQYTMQALEEFENSNPEISVKATYGSWKGYDKRMHIYM